MSPTSILIYGKDTPLLNSRRLLLEHAGYHVTACTDLQAVKQLLASRAFNIFVLCHTLSGSDRESALAASRLADAPPLNLILNTAFTNFFGNVDDEITAFCDPESFVRITGSLYSRLPPELHE